MRSRVLEWDSAFFGFTVARVVDSQLSAYELLETLQKLKQQQVRLAYWCTDEEPEAGVVKRFQGLLADMKVTFAIAFNSVDFDRAVPTNAIEPFSLEHSISDLESLAVQSGEYSRFAFDSSIPKDKFTSLFKLWIKRSVQKEIASEVLLIRDCGTVAGMVTLGDRGGRGDIGLMAVGTPYRGRGYGEGLVRAAQRWFLEHGYADGQVVTQERNIPACNLYRKCGYSIEKVEYVYHFWL